MGSPQGAEGTRAVRPRPSREVVLIAWRRFCGAVALARRLGGLLLLVAATPGSGCDLDLAQVLKGAGDRTFDKRLATLAQHLLDGIVSTQSFRADLAGPTSTKAVELWSSIYLEHYLSPPERFRQDRDWRPLLDSLSGPLRRWRDHVKEERWTEAHGQLRLAHGILAEILGQMPVMGAGLTAVSHTLGTLNDLSEVSARSATEVASRTQLLRRRIDAWLETTPERVSSVPAARSLLEELEGLEKAVSAKHWESARARVQSLAGLRAGLNAQASRAAWGLPPLSGPTAPGVPKGPPAASPDGAGVGPGTSLEDPSGF